LLRLSFPRAQVGEDLAEALLPLVQSDPVQVIAQFIPGRGVRDVKDVIRHVSYAADLIVLPGVCVSAPHCEMHPEIVQRVFGRVLDAQDIIRQVRRVAHHPDPIAVVPVGSLHDYNGALGRVSASFGYQNDLVPTDRFLPLLGSAIA